MGNLSMSIKKFMQNKNTVTVIGIILAIFVLYFAYTMRIKKAINPITVPYATEQILSGQRITESMISTRQIPPSMLDGEVIINKAEIVDRYTASDTIIPKGSLFYKRAVVEKEQIDIEKKFIYPNGWVLYSFPVNINTTYGNSIFPGNYVDIWLKIVYKYSDENENAVTTFGLENADKIRYGKLISNVKVLSVIDASGNDVFQNMDEKRAPANVIFALPESYFELLKKAENLGAYDAVIELVPTNESLKDNPGEVEITSEDIENFINQNTATGS